MIRFSSFLIVALALVVFAGCAHQTAGGSSVFSGGTGAQVSGPLELRADSLIARLLTTPGSFDDDGHVYTFITDQTLLNDLTVLEMHAVPRLIECIGDARPSRVEYVDRQDGDTKKALRGAVCFQVLINTHFWQMRDDTLFRRVEKAIPCGAQEVDRFGDCIGGRYSGYYAASRELRRTQRIWRAYLAAYQSAARPVIPRLSQTAVGCYSVVFRPSHVGPVVIDSARRIAFELDTLPLPGTVRPSPLRLTDSVTIAGPAMWRVHYEDMVLVSWGDRAKGARLSITFGGSDSTVAGYQFIRDSGDTGETIGKAEVARVPCSAGLGR